MSKTCYSPVKGLDDVIANEVTGWNKYLVANLRGLYQEKTGKDLTKPSLSITPEVKQSLFNPTNIETVKREQYANTIISAGYTIKSLSIPTEEEEGLANNVTILFNNGKKISIGTQGGSANGDLSIEGLSSFRQFVGLSYMVEKFIDNNPEEISKISTKDTSMSTMAKDVYGDNYDPTKDNYKSMVNNFDINKVVKTLVEFRRSLSKEDAKRILDAINNPTISYRQLKESFSAEERFNRISMISTMFSGIIDEVQEANPNVSRKEICSGFTIDGQQVGGISSIFNEIYDRLQERYSYYVEENNSEMINKYQKIFDNWGALLSFAKIRIKEVEDLKIGQDISFADDANSDNFNDNNLSEKFIMEESKREGWMEQSELESSFGSIGKQVRKVIGRTPQYKNGEPIIDDLGFPVMQDAVKIHQELLDILRGVNSESEMIQALTEYSSTVGWVTPFMEELNDPSIRTQFYTNFKKNFQIYSMQTEKVEGNVRTYKSPILNRVKGDKPFSQFLTSVKLGKVFNPAKSIFEKSGTSTRVMPVRVEKLKNDILDKFQVSSIEQKEYERKVEEYNKNPLKYTKPRLPKTKFDNMNKLEQKVFLINITEALNLNIDGDTIERILARKSNLKGITEQLLQVAQFGLNLSNEEKEGITNISYEALIKKPSSNEKKGVLREKITKILAIVAKSRENLKLESRVRYSDNTYFSNIIPSFMGDRFDKIESFVKNNNIKGLQSMLDKTYLSSSYFKYNGKILNKWIEELYNSDLSTDDSFAANFKYKRFLGSDKFSFDNFTSKQHAVQLLNEYFSERQISPNSQYAWYPVFILGDSGISKFIKAKRYSSKDILEGMYNVYIQEKRRIELVKAVNRKMKSDNVKTIDNFSKSESKFSILTFLNDPKYNSIINEDNLEQTVKEAIKTYMSDAVDTFKNKLSNLGVLEQSNNEYTYLSKEVKGDKTIDKVLSDYYWNTKFAIIQQLQMMTIDPSFYKGTKDLQKRYKEIHASGTALSIEAVNPFTGEKYSDDGIERVVYFDDIDVNAENFDPKFMNAIASHFGKDSSVYNLYKQNTLTDGQGYRTLESYRKVMGMSGQWNERMESAYNQIQTLRSEIGKDENPSMEAIKAISDLAVIFQPIKPYLFSFEDYEGVLKIPVQHKYAEAILIPELLPAGSKLRDIAYWMNEHVNSTTGKSEPIDMIGSTKIVKVGGFGSVDISNVTSDNISSIMNTGYVHQLDYNDYRIQTNVPEHINSSQLFGTQVRKLIMAKVQKYKDYSNYIKGNNVNLGGKYGKVKLTGVNLVRFYNTLISANIIDSYNLFEKTISNIENVSNRLIQTTANNSRESKDNIIAYSLNSNNEFTIPLFEGGLEHDSSALLFSLFKKMVNKQSIKGGSAVQVSAMGIKGYEEDGNLQYVVDPNNPNNILYAECEIPWDLSYIDNKGNEHSLDFNTYCNEDGTLKVDNDGNNLLEKTYPNILSLLAYRIPTERDYSMINLKVKRFSHKIAGGTIKVPPQGTTIAGFDFDIDKLYFMRNEYQQRKLTSSEIKNIWSDFYNTYPNLKAVLEEAREEDTESLDRLYKYWEKAELPYSYKEAFSQFVADKGYIKFEEYDFSRSPLENSKAARNNMLINLIQQRLSDVETFKERYTPGGFSNASKAAKLMRVLIFGDVKMNHREGTVDLSSIIKSIDEGLISDPEPDYDPSDPMTIITYNQQNNVAGKLIGIFANQNTNHAFASLMNEFYLKKPISFAGKTYSDFLHNSDIDTSLTVAEFLAASVDAVKDPVLNFLNLNTITADAGAMLARLGYTTEDIGLLFNQPIIKDICEYSFNNGMSDVNSVILNVLDTYKLKNDISKASLSEFDKEQLAYNIAVSATENKEDLLDDSDFVERQIHIANLFKEIIEASNDVSQFVRNTKFTASNAVGSTFGDSYSQQMKVASYIESFGNDSLKINLKVSDFTSIPINNKEDVLTFNNQDYLETLIENPFAYEQAMFDANRKASKVINKFYPYNNTTYVNVRNTLAGLTKNGILDADTINSIHSDLMVYMLSQQENSLFNGNMPITVDGNTISAREYFTEIFPEGLFNILEANPIMKSMPIFQYMQFQTDEKTGKVSMNIQDIGGLAPYKKDELRESWGDLMLNKDTAEIAQSLFLYNYYKLGFTFSPLAFMNLAPSEVKLSVQVGYDYNGNLQTYTDFLNNVKKDNIKINSHDFAKQYILNHLDNNKLVFQPKGRSGKFINSLAFNNGVAVENFTLDINKLKNDANPFLISSKDGVVFFRPVILIDDVVYMCNSEEDVFNMSSSGSINYYRVDPLGESNKSIKYTSTNVYDTKSSNTVIIQDNSNTSVEPEVDNIKITNISTEDLIKEATNLAMKADNTLQKDLVLEMLSKASREDLLDTINSLKTQTDNMIDQEGNKIC